MSDPHDYAHVHDPQAQRTRFELWLIVAIVVVVVGGALIWRSVAHQAAQPQKGWGNHTTAYPAAGNTPAAAAGVHPGSPPPRPAGP